MTKYICEDTFLDGRERFERGESLSTEGGQGCRVVTKEQASRFATAKWVRKLGEDAKQSPADPVGLDIASVIHGQGVSHG